ncbi:tail assembly protein [Salinisphaera hydrothermalis]|uniref:tail assembly protein n=1 Tax=Salinisphaera hydrothermalis TaxID=563188 RepID=UPI00333F0745
MLRDIYLHNRLAKEYGDHYRLDVETPREAVWALSMQLPGFRESIEAGSWHVLRGPLDAENDLDLEGTALTFGRTQEMHLIADGQGAGKGIFETIAGVALIAVGAATWEFGGEYLAYAGGAMLAGGVTQMLSKTPSTGDYSSRESAAQRPSFIFNGATNTSTQGLPVPLIYGRMRVGSVVVSAGLDAEQIPATQGGNGG